MAGGASSPVRTPLPRWKRREPVADEGAGPGGAKRALGEGVPTGRGVGKPGDGVMTVGAWLARPGIGGGGGPSGRVDRAGMDGRAPPRGGRGGGPGWGGLGVRARISSSPGRLSLVDDRPQTPRGVGSGRPRESGSNACNGGGPGYDAAPMDEAPPIKSVDLVKVYATGTRAVDGVSLELVRGELLGLLGPNGAGKSTFIKMLATLVRPTGGLLEVFGVDPCKDPATVRNSIAYVSQEVALDKVMTGREHLELHAALYHVKSDERAYRIGEVLELVGLSDRADERVGGFSGGMKKRLDIACGLLHSPQLLILDEPTLGLDIHTRRKIWEFLRQLKNHGVTILLTTHYLDEADMISDRVAIIDRGRIQALGTPEELKKEVKGDVVNVRLVGAAPAPEDETEKEESELLNAAANDGIAKALKDIDGVLEVRATGFGNFGVSVDPEGGGLVEKILDGVRSKGHHVESIEYARPSLDDVFFLHTGYSMRE